MKRSPLRQRGRKAAARHAEDFGEQAQRCRGMPCAACVYLRLRQDYRTEPHHEPPRSRGGTDADTMPLCTYHHHRRHAVGPRAFWRRVGLDPAAVLERVRAHSPTPGDPFDHVPF